jgi:hypothetical protein
MQELIRFLLVHNCECNDDTFRLLQDVLASPEWRDLAAACEVALAKKDPSWESQVLSGDGADWKDEERIRQDDEAHRMADEQLSASLEPESAASVTVEAAPEPDHGPSIEAGTRASSPVRAQPSPPAVAEQLPVQKSAPEAPNFRQRRAEVVAQVIGELNVLRPLIVGLKEYNEQRALFPDYLTFKVAEKHPNLKEKLLYIQHHVQHRRLALEIAAAHFGKERTTIESDWKKYKPAEFRRAVGPELGVHRKLKARGKTKRAKHL